MTRIHLRGAIAAQSLLVIVLGLFGNQVSGLVNLPREWLLGGFLLLLTASILIQSAHRVPTIAAVRGGPPNDAAGAIPTEGSYLTGSPIPAVSFPLGLLFGAVFVTLAILFDTREGGIWLHYLVMARPYEVNAGIAGILCCVAYRWIVGAEGLGLFGLGIGLSIGATLLVLVPDEHVPIFTLFAHTVVLFSAALTLKATKASWRYGLALPSGLVAIYVAPAVMYRAISLMMGSPAGVQFETIDLFAPGTHRVNYEQAYEQPPFLSVEFNGSYPPDARLRVVEQSQTGFELDIQSSEFPLQILFRARGVPAKR